MMLRGDVVVGKLFFISVTVALPILFFLYAILKRGMFAFLLGILAFVSSQMLIRMPLLEIVVAQSSTYKLLMMTKPVLILFILSLSAGIIEETARWILMQFYLKSQVIMKSIFFGLGHGGIEALLVVAIPIMISEHYISMLVLWISGIERVFAITIHVCLSVIVFIGVSMKRVHYVFIAMAIHTGINFTCAYLATMQSPIKVELTLATLSFLLVIWTIQLCRGKWNNEKNNCDFM